MLDQESLTNQQVLNLNENAKLISLDAFLAAGSADKKGHTLVRDKAKSCIDASAGGSDKEGTSASGSDDDASIGAWSCGFWQ